jgi:MFS family permease
MLTYVALPYQVYLLTRSSLAVGLLGLAELGPLLVTVFLGGALADAFDRRTLVLWTEASLAAGSGLLAAYALLDAPPVWPLFLAAGVLSALGGLQRPSLDSLTPRFVDREEIPAAAALSMLRGSVGMIAGPALAGVLIAGLGLASTYAADLLSYLLSLLAFRMIRAVPPPDGAPRPSLTGVLEGIRYATRRQELVGTYVVDFVAMVFGMPLALFPAIADRLGGPRLLGLLYASPAVGALVASLTSRWTPRVHRHGRAVLVAAAAWGVAIVAFGFSDRIPLALAFLAFAGAADGVSGLFRTTIWNQTIPDDLRGRLASIEIVSYTSGPLLGHAEAGAAAALGGVRFSVVSGGALCVIGVLACALFLPGFLAYDARALAAGRLGLSTDEGSGHAAAEPPGEG